MWTDTNDAVLALLDALKAVSGVIAAHDATMSTRMIHSFALMEQQYLAKKNPDGALVMNELRSHLASQQDAQNLNDSDPHGRA